MQVKVSPKYQVVIPFEVRKILNIQPGARVEVIPYENRIEFVLLKDIKDMRGFLKGIDTTIERDGDRL